MALLSLLSCAETPEKNLENFKLDDVQLLDGPFKHALDLNVDVLLEYDVDRLLAPFFKEAGLELKAEVFPNWEGLDGHVAGHYLSAMAIHYAATGNPECKQRMEYILSELKVVQTANGNGYIGGVPNSKNFWNEIKSGNVQEIYKYWVPWYNVHKMFAGLRDAYTYGGNGQALQMFLELCDWGIDIIAPLTDEQMEIMVGSEFGGMNEVYADAYQLSGDVRYLDAAKRFTHHWLYDSMLARVDNMDNKHANTQVPKAVGYQRVAEMSELAGLTDDAQNYHKAADFFWHTVAETRSLSFGGNSRREHFPSADDCLSYVDDREGPETCNTFNMLKLTSGLFRMNPDAHYADFYERAMYNHILSTQHPEHGGYVYFTSARPAHYRVYSAPNSGMWCCVGTGMENHGKYGEFIYSHSDSDLYLNLFVASKLDWKDKGVTLTQETSFPDSETTRISLNMDNPVKFRLLVRKPWWIDGNMEILCNGKKVSARTLKNGYVAIDRKWKDGDVLDISLPMKLTIEELPNVPNYIAIMKGPVLMGARMGTHDLYGLVADDGRWAHIAHGSLVSLMDTPMIIGERTEILNKLEQMKPVDGKPLCYTVDGLFHSVNKDRNFDNIVLEPFFRIHDSRYIFYFLSMEEDDFAKYLDSAREKEERKLQLDKRTVDAVNFGEQQPEADHQMRQHNTRTGNHFAELWREAYDGGFFQCTFSTKGQGNLSLMLRYSCDGSADARALDLSVNGESLDIEALEWAEGQMASMIIPVPEKLLSGKKEITVRVACPEGKSTPGVSQILLLK